jgi:UDP-GlcNAc:undecaprenyl-phosphate GlcNAc-1-phosphate transferase
LAEPALAGALLAALAWAIAAGVVAVLQRLGGRLPQAALTDRSLHRRPVPRVAGLALWAGFTPVAILAPPGPSPPPIVWLSAYMAVAAVSLADDWRGVAPAWRLAVQAGAAAAVAASVYGAPQGAADAAWIAALALAIVWSANLFNFMDGSDGLAATTAVVGFAAYAAAAAQADVAWAAYAALAAAATPVLAVNFPPARAFVGDVGAVPLGFLAATFGIGGIAAGAWPPWFPVLVFLPFVADASATLLRRLWRGERVWEAHRTHYYQRLHRLGAGHRGTLAVFGAATTGTAATAVAVLAIRPAAGGWALLAWTLAVAALFGGIDYHWKRRATAS